MVDRDDDDDEEEAAADIRDVMGSRTVETSMFSNTSLIVLLL